MSRRRSAIDERQVQGLKYLDLVLPRLAELHAVGCQRDKAGNRNLHYDQYVLLVLLFLFNPVLRSLRAVQQASLLKKVQKQLGCPRTSLGSLSRRPMCLILRGWKACLASCSRSCRLRPARSAAAILNWQLRSARFAQPEPQLKLQSIRQIRAL
jgi:hypothetical protein